MGTNERTAIDVLEKLEAELDEHLSKVTEQGGSIVEREREAGAVRLALDKVRRELSQERRGDVKRGSEWLRLLYGLRATHTERVSAGDLEVVEVSDSVGFLRVELRDLDEGRNMLLGDDGVVFATVRTNDTAESEETVRSLAAWASGALRRLKEAEADRERLAERLEEEKASAMVDAKRFAQLVDEMREELATAKATIEVEGSEGLEELIATTRSRAARIRDLEAQRDELTESLRMAHGREDAAKKMLANIEAHADSLDDRLSEYATGNHALRADVESLTESTNRRRDAIIAAQSRVDAATVALWNGDRLTALEKLDLAFDVLEAAEHKADRREVRAGRDHTHKLKDSFEVVGLRKMVDEEKAKLLACHEEARAEIVRLEALLEARSDDRRGGAIENMESLRAKLSELFGPLPHLCRDWPAHIDAAFVAALETAGAAGANLSALLGLGEVRVVFDGPPGAVCGRFVEVEDSDGRGINAGEWRERADGRWELVIPRIIRRPDGPIEARDRLDALEERIAALAMTDDALEKAIDFQAGRVDELAKEADAEALKLDALKGGRGGGLLLERVGSLEGRAEKIETSIEYNRKSRAEVVERVERLEGRVGPLEERDAVSIVLGLEIRDGEPPRSHALDGLEGRIGDLEVARSNEARAERVAAELVDRVASLEARLAAVSE